jgi:hypothetical protein
VRKVGLVCSIRVHDVDLEAFRLRFREVVPRGVSDPGPVR